MNALYSSSLFVGFLSGASVAALFASIAWPLSERQKTKLWRLCQGSVSMRKSIVYRVMQPAPVLAALCGCVVLVGGAA